MLDKILEFAETTGFYMLFGNIKENWGNLVMILVSLLLLWLAIHKKFEPLLLIGIAFGMLLTNLPGAEMYHEDLWHAFIDPENPAYHSYGAILGNPDCGLLDVLYIGVKTGLYPCLIFIGIGAMTDFGPLLANPSSLLLGAAAQLGIYVAFLIAIVIPEFRIGNFVFDGFTAQEAASIAIIGGADGPTAIYLTGKLASHLLGPIAVAAYSYMALIPLIQPPIMKLLTTKKEREIKMDQLRTVSKAEKIIFPIVVTVLCVLIIPSTAPLIGMLMLGNLFKESGVTDRLSDTAQNALCNIVTIMLGVTVGATAEGKTFLDIKTILVIVIGLIAFAFSTAGGVLFGKLMNVITKGKVNPLIGSAGVSAVPMAARVSQVEGRKYNPSNFLLMHAMGPNVAGVIGSAVAAGFLLLTFGN